jgi:polyhydroxyalkanoate synthesis regulator protein
MMENLTKPMSGVPAFDAMRAQQEAFLKAMTGGMANWSAPGHEDEAEEPAKDELHEIRKQLSDLQAQLAKMGGK